MAFAQAPASNDARTAKGKQMRHRAVKALNLTDAQKQQRKALAEQTKQNAAPLRQELTKNRQAMAEAVRNGRERVQQRLNRRLAKGKVG